MQTFLAYACFKLTAKVLDKKRLFKQLVEARQLLATIGVKVYKNDGSLYKATHKNHPAVNMWRNNPESLMLYHNMILEECLVRGINTEIQPFNISENITHPKWLGNESFHASHRSNLIRKQPEHYSKFGWTEPTDLCYIWPVN